MTEKLTIIANCQAWPLAQAAASIGHDVRVRFICLNDVAVEGSFSNLSMRRLIEDEAAGEELVYTFNASSTFAPADTESLREVFGERLKTFSNIRFDGLHPDSTYFGGFGGRSTATMGEYHSKLIIYAYASGRSEADCAQLFNGLTYEQLGYFDIWSDSANYLLDREKQCDVKVVEKFLADARDQLPLFTFNHPTSSVLHDVARAVLIDAGIKNSTIGGSHFANSLYQNFIWPVYPEIIEHFGLKYSGGYTFFNMTCASEDYFSSRPISLEDLIHHDFAIYRDQGTVAQFREAAAQLPFFERMSNAIG